MTIAELVRERLGIELDELRGASAVGAIPVPDGLINRVLAARLAGTRAPVARIDLAAQNGDAFDAILVPRASWMPHLRIHARIDRQADLPHDPVIWLRWSIAGVGLLSRLAGPALGWLDALPRGVRAAGDRLGVDLRELLAARGLQDALGYVKWIRVHTQPGAFVVRIELEIAGAGDKTPAP
ncbi:MAG TPA: hypothetical protein VNI78_10220 [Vicinamibacterales bacterium]|nr:hypothetical protein [Vicinamibacterales bacterium]